MKYTVILALYMIFCSKLSTAPPVDEPPPVSGFPREQQFIDQILQSARSLQHESRPEQGQGFIQHILRNAEALQREQERRQPPFIPPEEDPTRCSGAAVNIVFNINGIQQPPLVETDVSDSNETPSGAEGDFGNLLSDPNARNLRIEVG